jgi:GxxExxY protein
MTELRDPLTHNIIGAAIEVHRHMGPGLLESAYEECLTHELSLRNLAVRRQVAMPISYKGQTLELGYRPDLVVDGQVVVELKCVEKLISVHEAQLLTYLRLSGIERGLLINFMSNPLINGIKRLVRTRSANSQTS